MSVCAALAGCEGPLSTLDPAGPAARMVAALWWAMLAGAAVLNFLVLALVAWGFRPAAARAVNARFWALGMGVAMPLVVLVVLVGAGLWMGERMQAESAANVVHVQADARQWAWRFVQPGRSQQMVETENVLFIPAGKPVHVALSSRDVIHSFWVPRLGGKMDAIPGHRNVLRIQADAPGRYEGLSAEFSGVGYGEMRFTVVAYPVDQVPDMAVQALGTQSIDEPGAP